MLVRDQLECEKRNPVSELGQLQILEYR